MFLTFVTCWPYFATMQRPHFRNVLWDEKQDVTYVVIAHQVMLRSEVLRVIAASFERGEIAEPKRGDVVTIESLEAWVKEEQFLPHAHKAFAEKTASQAPRQNV